MLTQNQYGQTFDQVKKIVRPSSVKMPWGDLMICANRQQYCLTRLRLESGGIKPLAFTSHSEVTYLIEQGSLLVRKIERNGNLVSFTAKKGNVIHLERCTPHSFFALEEALIYGFSGQDSFKSEYQIETPDLAAHQFSSIRKGNPPPPTNFSTQDFREKYWGSIETVVSSEVAGKRILVHAEKQSSMEFHVDKIEAYYIHSGEVKVGLRVGRGENKSVILTQGDLFEVFPGTMHMRIGMKDSVIIEVSTRDNDADSHLVEDGMKYKHTEN